jgi:hypothetical protein
MAGGKRIKFMIAAAVVAYSGAVASHRRNLHAGLAYSRILRCYKLVYRKRSLHLLEVLRQQQPLEYIL